MTVDFLRFLLPNYLHFATYLNEFRPIQTLVGSRLGKYKQITITILRLLSAHIK